MEQDYYLKPTADVKTRFYPGQKNTYGLPPGPGGSCRGATTTKGGCWNIPVGRKLQTCYVAGVMNFRPAVKGLLEHNFSVLKSAETVEGMTAVLRTEFQRFKDTEIRRAARTQQPAFLTYRIHWAGDFFNDDYARAVGLAIRDFPEIKFWAYTRVWSVIPILKDIDNLILYMSLDRVNVSRGLLVYEDNGGTTNPNLRYCYMSRENNFVDHQEFLTPILAGRNRVREIMGSKRLDSGWLTEQALRICPVDAGKLAHESGCPTCGRCLSADKTPVWFES